jgi:hypothetical protein
VLGSSKGEKWGGLRAKVSVSLKAEGSGGLKAMETVQTMELEREVG